MADTIDKINNKGYNSKWNVSFLGRHLSSLTMNSIYRKHQRPTRAERKETMFSDHFNALRGRLIGTLLASIVLAASLAACGGGGGGSSTPTPPPVVATGSVSAVSNCTIAQDASSCQVTVSFTTSNTSSPKLVVGTTTVSTAAAATAVPVTIGNVTLAVTLSDGQTVLDNTKSVTGSCISGTSWDGNACKQTVAHYTDKVYALWSSKYPFSVTKTGVTRVTNMTKYVAVGGGFDLFGCLISSYALSDGKIPLLCKDGVQFKFHELYIDPVKEEVHEFVGVLPADLSYVLTTDGTGLTTFSAKWGDVVQDIDPLHPTWEARAKVVDGWYFSPNNQNSVLYFQDNTGNVSTVAQKVPLIDGNVRIMFSYSN